MDAMAITASAPQLRLHQAISGEGFLFQFPRDIGTPELLRLAMAFEASGDAAVAYGSPSAKSIAEIFEEGLSFVGKRVEDFGQQTLPEVLRRKCSRRLAYFTSPLGTSQLFHVSIFDEQGLALGGQGLHDLIDAKSPWRDRAITLPPPVRTATLPGSRARPGTRPVLLIESPSTAVVSAMRPLAADLVKTSCLDTLLMCPQAAMENAKADWGAWIDAECGALQLFDGVGNSIASEAVLEALALYLTRPGDSIVLEEGSAQSLLTRLRRFGLRVVQCPASRPLMGKAMCDFGAVLGGGPGGRFWFGNEIGAPDAITAVNHWVQGASGYLRRAATSSGVALSRLAA
jgi:hypothetical protein